MHLQIRDIWNPRELCVWAKVHRSQWASNHWLLQASDQTASDLNGKSKSLWCQCCSQTQWLHLGCKICASFKTFPGTRTWTQQSSVWMWPIHLMLSWVIPSHSLTVQWSRDCFQQAVFMQPSCFGGKGIVSSHLMPVGFSAWKAPRHECRWSCCGSRSEFHRGYNKVALA